MLIEGLDDDSAMEVLSRCPARSLLRFKVVSKAWKAVIEDPPFIVLHRQNRENYRQFLSPRSYRDSRGGYSHRFCFLNRQDEDQVLALKDIDFPFRFPCNLRVTFLQIEAEVDGIFLVKCCTQDASDALSISYYLWNPSTTEFMVIPFPQLFEIKFAAPAPAPGPPPTTRPRRRRIGLIELLGLVFDYKSNFVKVLRMSFTIGAESESDERWAVRADVWSSGSRSWREMEMEMEMGSVICSSPLMTDLLYPCGASVNLGGKCYFYLITKSHPHEWLLSFDIVGDQKLQLSLLPDQVVAVREYLKNIDSIIQLKGCLGLFRTTGNGNRDGFDVWVMSKQGCWSKHLTVRGSSYPIKRVMFFNEMEVIIAGRGEMLVHNLITSKTARMEVDMEKMVEVGLGFCIYKETMISFRPKPKIAIDTSPAHEEIEDQ